jgi:hypothetical protein
MVVSADGKTRTLTTKGTDAKGTLVASTRVTTVSGQPSGGLWVRRGRYSTRKASTGDVRLARNAGTQEARAADAASARAAASTTAGLNGLMPYS